MATQRVSAPDSWSLERKRNDEEEEGEEEEEEEGPLKEIKRKGKGREEGPNPQFADAEDGHVPVNIEPADVRKGGLAREQRDPVELGQMGSIGEKDG